LCKNSLFAQTAKQMIKLILSQTAQKPPSSLFEEEGMWFSGGGCRKTAALPVFEAGI
jgi:hypothetical protein